MKVGTRRRWIIPTEYSRRPGLRWRRRKIDKPGREGYEITEF